MSETTPDAAPTNGNGKDQGPEVALNVHGQYIKDFSFEVPGSPQIFMDEAAVSPEMNLNLDVQVEGLTDETFEVILDISAETKIGEKTAYILELKYAGLFTVNVPEEHRAGVLFVECARLLFPFARAVLADVTRDGGFQPLILGPVDFAHLFEQNIEKIRSQTEPE